MIPPLSSDPRAHQRATTSTDYLAIRCPGLVFELEFLWSGALQVYGLAENAADCRWTSRLLDDAPAGGPLVEIRFEGKAGRRQVCWGGLVPVRFVEGLDRREVKACFAFNAGRFLQSWRKALAGPPRFGWPIESPDVLKN